MQGSLVSTICELTVFDYGVVMKWQVPRYHCMPRKGELIDGRIGSWSNEELAKHISEEGHAIVSNEWDPFRLVFSSTLNMTAIVVQPCSHRCSYRLC